MNVPLLIGSLVLLAIGGIAVMKRESLWEAHARRSTLGRRNPGDPLVWKRNSLRGGLFLIVLGVLGIVAMVGAALTAPPA